MGTFRERPFDPRRRLREALRQAAAGVRHAGRRSIAAWRPTDLPRSKPDHEQCRRDGGQLLRQNIASTPTMRLATMEATR